MSRTEIEKRHEDILKKLAVMCRSSDKKFTDETRIKVIRELLQDSGYKEFVLDNAPASIWSKVPAEEMNRNMVIVSTHADIVPSINTCSSNLDENGIYQGTYDNIGTNAAALILMLEANLDKNIVFAFTGDEETGGCRGAKKTASYFFERGKRPTCIALDVTFEGFWDNFLCSMENASAPKEQEEEFLNAVVDALYSTEGEKQTFQFVKIGKKHIPTKIESKYLSPSSGMYDEGMAYRDEGYPALSLCLPCYGHMHSNSGVAIKQPVFEGFLASLYTLVSKLTKTNEVQLEEIRALKDELVTRAEEIEYKKPVPTYKENYFSQNYNTGWHESLDTGWLSPGSNGRIYSYSGNDKEFYSSYEDELSSLESLLFAEASMYSSDEEDIYVRDMDIPQEYYRYFCSNPEDAILDSEWDLMEKFVRDVFRQAHGLEREFEGSFMEMKGEHDEYDEEDDYRFLMGNSHPGRYKASSYSFSDYEEDEDYEAMYADYTSL